MNDAAACLITVVQYTQWLLGVGAALGGGIAQLALSIFCAFFFYRDGEAALHRLTMSSGTWRETERAIC